MTAQVKFIGRTKELARIDKIIADQNANCEIVCIYGDGGIGKTRLSNEIYRLYQGRSGFFVADIIDFDDQSFHVTEGIQLRLVEKIGTNHFEIFISRLQDYRKMHLANVSAQTLTREKQQLQQGFVGEFNEFTKNYHVILIMDTTDALPDINFLIEFISDQILNLTNTSLILSGRNAKAISHALEMNYQGIYPIKLTPFSPAENELYLKEKRKIMRTTNRLLGENFEKNLLSLTKGHPILIDMAMEWHIRNIPMTWLTDTEEIVLDKLTPGERTKKFQEFEAQLVKSIIQLRTPIDQLILVLSYVYPLDEQMVNEFFRPSPKNRLNLFQEVKTFTFVKSLPDGRITLHDEMRRMVDKYVWPEIDIEKKGRQREYSEKAIKHLKKYIKKLTDQIETIKSSDLLGFIERETVEQRIWNTNSLLLKHTLVTSNEEGIRLFTELFDKAWETSRYSIAETLLLQMHKEEGDYQIARRKIDLLLYSRQYQVAINLATEIIEQKNIAPKQIIDTLIQRGNAEIRLGNVKKGLLDFQTATKTSEENGLKSHLIQAKNALGWAHRLLGDLDEAKKHYLKAKSLCQEIGMMGEVYGWILNNLTFVLSDQNRDAARIIGKQAVQHWESIDNKIGLGAGYLVLGIMYYRRDELDESISAFGNAINIFKPFGHFERLGEIYSWRGALYQDQEANDPEAINKAETDLRESLKLGANNIRAMTLNRLARVYMSRKQWNEAEAHMVEALKKAREIPDYVYWLGSIARLISIASEKREYSRLEEFERRLENCLNEIPSADQNSLGMAYLGLARLALGQGKTVKVIAYLTKGIPLVTDYGSYARADIQSRLAHVEKDFINIESATVHSIAKNLIATFGEKELDDIKYSVVTNIMYRWQTWSKTNA